MAELFLKLLCLSQIDVGKPIELLSVLLNARDTKVRLNLPHLGLNDDGGLSMLVLSMPVRRAANSGGPGGPPCPHYSIGSHPLRVAFACGVMAV